MPIVMPDGPMPLDVQMRTIALTALVFERYLWGEWSKGIAEHAIDQASSDAADAIEAEYQKKMKEGDAEIEVEFEDEPPIKPHSGSR